MSRIAFSNYTCLSLTADDPELWNKASDNESDSYETGIIIQGMIKVLLAL